MKWHAEIFPADPGFRISHSDKLVLSGSCFSSNIGELLQSHGFSVLANPLGISFNPCSVASALSDAIEQIPPASEKIFDNAGKWLSYDYHSSFNASSREALLELIASAQATTRKALSSASRLFVTFGSAYAYRLLSTGDIVANCHRQPQSTFKKELLSQQEIRRDLQRLAAALSKLNAQCRLVLTVSPVRHLRDGVVNNALSKAMLLVAANGACTELPGCGYFPAYELVTEDLKDHRFYEADLAHPNGQAIQYVWQKFQICYFDDTTRSLVELIGRYLAAKRHRQISDNGSADHLRGLEEQVRSAIPTLPDAFYKNT